MGENKSKENISALSNDTVTTTTKLSDVLHPRRHTAQNFLLIWLDTFIDQSNKDYQNTLEQLRNVVNDFSVFKHPDECVDFLTEIDDIKVFLIVEDILAQQMVPLIHDISQLDSVYIFCNNRSGHEQWTKEWIKVKGIHTEMITICESLQLAVKQCNENSISVSFVTVDEETSNPNCDQLEPSFMYTQILKEILLQIEHDEQSIKNFATYCRNGDYGAPSNINRFENDYYDRTPIWWYTWSSFIFSMLNRALRTLNADTIITMGFFIHDLHHQIERLHQQQIVDHRGQPFIVYRGQSLSKIDFEKLLKTIDGLMSFNNFLSTSMDAEVSLGYAEGALTDDGTVGILFKIFVDPSISSAPFASIREFSYFNTEEEILFSMHTVFRVVQITPIDNKSQLYQVDLKLTGDDDQELRTLTEHIRDEVAGENGWQQLGRLLLKIGQFDKAEDLYNVLLDQATNENEKAIYYNQLGYIQYSQGDYGKAICYYEKALQIYQKFLHPNHSDLATSYNNLGLAHDKMREYSKALAFLEQALPMSLFFDQNRRLTAVLKKTGGSSGLTLFHHFLIEFSVKSILSVPKTSIFNRKSRL
jgi:tetratricopeptide (TPR) repeat protein